MHLYKMIDRDQGTHTHLIRRWFQRAEERERQKSAPNSQRVNNFKWIHKISVSLSFIIMFITVIIGILCMRVVFNSLIDWTILFGCWDDSIRCEFLYVWFFLHHAPVNIRMLATGLSIFFFSVDGQTQLTKIVRWCTHNTPSLRSTSVHCGCCEFQSLSTSYTIIKYKKSCISTTDQVSLWMVFKRWIFHQIFHAQLILKYYTWKIHTAKCVCTRVRQDCDFCWRKEKKNNTHTHTIISSIRRVSTEQFEFSRRSFLLLFLVFNQKLVMVLSVIDCVEIFVSLR